MRCERVWCGDGVKVGLVKFAEIIRGLRMENITVRIVLKNLDTY